VRRNGHAPARQLANGAGLEINEAFASVALHATRMLGADPEIVNVNGRSVALGHALGSTGARMIVTPCTKCAAAR
jgi:acetyl-CoA acetyltransferase